MTPAIQRRDFLRGLALSVAASGGGARLLAADPVPPNLIVIFCDDLGYGDLGCFGSMKHQTPHLDRMAAEGRRFTSFYVTSGVCTPSRSSLLTGCYPRRVDMHQDSRGAGVLFPIAAKGLNPEEVTIAEVLRGAGYATACIGKWHLGDQREFLPTRQGFDSYFGLPYSNDMMVTRRGDPPLPLLRDETVIEAPVDQDTLTRRYTEEACRFIRAHHERPFFLYLPHSMVHNPCHASATFRGKSANGIYGDALAEVDWSTGEILETLRELGLDRRTVVVFTSDNGASNRFGGSNQPLSGWKGSTMEGGMRVPCLMWGPGTIPAGTVCDEMATTMDLLPTFAAMAGTTPPAGRILDGKDIGGLVSGRPGARSPHEAFYYYQRDRLQAVRSGKWKLHVPLEPVTRANGKTGGGRQLKLVDLQRDIAEADDVSAANPDVVTRLMALAEKARRDLGDRGRPGANQRQAAAVVTPVPLLLPGTVWPPPEKTEFVVKPGQTLAGAAAPKVAGRGLSLAVDTTAPGNGVILAHGGAKVGYALTVMDGKVSFHVRRDWEELATVSSPHPLPNGVGSIEASLARDGAMRLTIDGDVVAEGKAEGCLPNQPAEPLSVGCDDKEPVGPYDGESRFTGKFGEVVLRLRPR